METSRTQDRPAGTAAGASQTVPPVPAVQLRLGEDAVRVPPAQVGRVGAVRRDDRRCSLAPTTILHVPVPPDERVADVGEPLVRARRGGHQARGVAGPAVPAGSPTASAIRPRPGRRPGHWCRRSRARRRRPRPTLTSSRSRAVRLERDARIRQRTRSGRCLPAASRRPHRGIGVELIEELVPAALGPVVPGDAQRVVDPAAGTVTW